jgi:threonine/homoserine/homoserine lactone efflux protein
MSQQLLIAFVVFATVALYTPGPNNIMLMTSGLNFGFRRTLPHVVGVNIGFALIVVVFGLGLGAVFETWPVLQTVLKYAGAAYLAYLAVMIALTKPGQAKEVASGRPMSFFGAMMFQWVNVKGLVTATGAVTAYAAIGVYPWNMLTLAGLFFAIGLTSSSTWVLFGTSLQGLVKSRGAMRAFNIVMALLLLMSLFPVLTGA